MDELAVQLFHGLRMLEHDLGYERAGLEVAAPLELEQITLRTQHGPLLEPLAKPGSSHASHDGTARGEPPGSPPTG